MFDPFLLEMRKYQEPLLNSLDIEKFNLSVYQTIGFINRNVVINKIPPNLVLSSEQTNLIQVFAFFQNIIQSTGLDNDNIQERALIRRWY